MHVLLELVRQFCCFLLDLPGTYCFILSFILFFNVSINMFAKTGKYIDSFI